MQSFEELMTRLQECLTSEDRTAGNISPTLRLLTEKLREASRFVSVSLCMSDSITFIPCYSS